MIEFEKEKIELARVYQNVFETENGQVIIEDLKWFILHNNPFYTENIKDDCMVREGARILLDRIVRLLEIDVDQLSNNENGGLND